MNIVRSLVKITKINTAPTIGYVGAQNKEIIMEEKIKVGVISLGCDKNRVDTENMMTYLKNSGNYEFTGDPSEATVIIINTCAFILPARTESQETIEEMIEYRRSGNCKCLVVTGCYPQKYIEDLTQKYKGVDIFLGTNEYKSIVDILSNYLNSSETKQLIKKDSPYCIDEVISGRLISTPSYMAYIRIADGCDNFCSYCTIPYIRGRYRSRKMESIIAEAKDLCSRGAKELVIVAQDTARYGEDIYGTPMLDKLLMELEKVKGLKWIRLLYCYPENITPELLAEINRNPKVCKYLDIPFQHISSDILKAMNRHITSEEVNQKLDLIKAAVPGVVIRSTFIVGFPGETKKEFGELLHFIRNQKLPNVGFFTYSREDGTVAARLPNQVDELTKKRRLLKLARAQKKVITEFNKSLVGETLELIIEGFDEYRGLYFGRTYFQASEIDTITYVSADKDLNFGEFYPAIIVKAKGYDLFGVVE